MKLRDIHIRTDDLSTDDQNPIMVEPVELLYLKNLKYSVDTTDVSRINICLSEKEEFRIGGLADGWLDCHIYFNTAEFYSLKDTYAKKLTILNTLLSAVLKCAEAKGWEKDPFLDAYNKCIKEQLKNEWWFKDKLFKSPNKEFHVGLYNIYDLNQYTVHIVVFNQKREELERRLVFKDDYLSFPLEWASWEKSNDTFYFKFNPPKKIFSIKISDVLEKVPYTLPAKTSDIFK